MRQSEIEECLAIYRKALRVYRRILDNLQAAHEAADGVPILRRTQRRIDAVAEDIAYLGDLMSLFPEMADLLQDERRINAMLRDQASQAGLVFRYDIKVPEEESDGVTKADL